MVVACALLLAGCVSQSTTQPVAPAASPPPAPAAPAFELEGTECILGGGHSVHSSRIAGFIIPEPWKVADILDDVGPQPVYPEEPEDGVPSKGNTWGNWHVTTMCEGWTYDGKPLAGHVFGFVGARVEAPPFDDGSAVRHYLITVLASSDHGLHEALHAAGFHASLTKGTIEYQVGDVFHHVLDTEDHGVYESLYRTVGQGEAPQGITRLWFQQENPDKTYSPIALDLQVRGGTHKWAEPNGYFSHLRTHDHDPLPGAAGNIAGLNWEGFDLVVTLGPRPDVKLQKAYIHV